MFLATLKYSLPKDELFVMLRRCFWRVDFRTSKGCMVEVVRRPEMAEERRDVERSFFLGMFSCFRYLERRKKE